MKYELFGDMRLEQEYLDYKRKGWTYTVIGALLILIIML